MLSLLAGFVTNRWWVSEATLCMGVGAAARPLLTALFHKPLGDAGFDLLHETAWLTIGIAVMGVALRLPNDWFAENRRKLAAVLLIGMPLMWLTGAGLAALTLGLALVPALLVGAILAPTDPVVATAVVGGTIAQRNARSEVRRMISAESGANDGLGLPFVLLCVLLLTRPAGEALWRWLADVVLWQVLGGVLFGLLAGYLAGRMFVWIRAKPTAEKQPMLAIGVALALTVLTSVKLLGGDGILAVFAAGLMFNRKTADIETRQAEVQGSIARFFDLPVFVLFGAMLPWAQWGRLGWHGVLFVILLLAFRRLPWWLLFRGFDRNLARREQWFIGWFGPVGVAAIYYTLLSSDRTGLAWLWPTASLAICVSIVAHGITATPLARKLGGADYAPWREMEREERERKRRQEQQEDEEREQRKERQRNREMLANDKK